VTCPATPDLQALIGLFYDDSESLARFEEVQSQDIPGKYRELLAHNDHMTVTVESFHDCRVDVDVLDTRLTGTHYARKILLRRQSDGRVVQFGIVRLNFDYLPPEVRDEIQAQQTPLGRVLIERDVMRTVQLVALWKVEAGRELCELLGVPNAAVTYGRTAVIYCNGDPAVEVLEVVTPVTH
jgi:chorismate-pyruvate lyase